MELNSQISQETVGSLDSQTRDKIYAAKLEHLFQKIERGLKTWNLKYLSWDPWILKDDEVYRLFYLVGSKKTYPFWKSGKIYGAISTNMKHWKEIGVILEPEPANSWESGRMLAGFTYKEDGIYYLFYSASGAEQILHEGIGLATSTDGINWQRSSNHELLEPDNRWYGKYNKNFFWRDPFIVKDHETGRYYMFISAHSKERVPSKFRGCIGLAVADKITGPYEVLPPAAEPLVDGTEESPYYEMERPQVIYKDGKYHLFFSTWFKHLNPKWLQTCGSEGFTDSSLYWYMSDTITGPFKPISGKPLVRGSDKTGMYGTNFFPGLAHSEKIIAYGWDYKRYTLKISQQFQVNWHDELLEIVS